MANKNWKPNTNKQQQPKPPVMCKDNLLTLHWHTKYTGIFHKAKQTSNLHFIKLYHMIRKRQNNQPWNIDHVTECQVNREIIIDIDTSKASYFRI